MGLNSSLLLLSRNLLAILFLAERATTMVTSFNEFQATNSSQGSVPPVRHIATKGNNSKSKTNENSETTTCERDLRKDSEKKAEKIKVSVCN